MVWEYEIMGLVQSLGLLGQGFFDLIFLLLTFLAEESFLLVVVFAIYWCGNKRLGEYLLLSLFLSLGANGFLKDVVRRLRPFLTPGWENMRYLSVDNVFVDTASLGGSFSFPSGHSQCAGGLFTALALWFNKRWVTVAAAALTLGVMLSRVYLGVHFPGDVLVGAALGVASSLLCWRLFNRYYRQRIWLFAGVAALLMPALLFAPSGDTVKTVGVGLGAVAGLLWEQRYIRFGTEGPAAKLAGRMLLGIVVVMVLRLGLKVILPQGLLFDGIRYGLVGLAATGIVPWLFVRLNLAKSS